MVTNYARYLTITVLDKFGNQIGDLYQGAEVTELPQGASQYVTINSPLTASSAYLLWSSQQEGIVGQSPITVMIAAVQSLTAEA